MDGSLRYQGNKSYPSADGLLVAQLGNLNVDSDAPDTFRVLDSSTSSVVYEGDGALDVHDMMFSPDGSLVAGCLTLWDPHYESALGVWKLDAGRHMWKILQGFTGPIAFTSDSLVLAVRDHGNFCAWQLDTGEVIAQAPYIAFEVDNFAHWQSKKDNPLYTQSGLIPMDDEGWIRTRDFRRVLWIPVEYRGPYGKMVTGGRKAAIPTQDGRLVVIFMADDQ
jgi:hypothetical protein